MGEPTDGTYLPTIVVQARLLVSSLPNFIPPVVCNTMVPLSKPVITYYITTCPRAERLGIPISVAMRSSSIDFHLAPHT